MALILDQQNPKPKKSMNSVSLKKEFFKVNLIPSFNLECIHYMSVTVMIEYWASGVDVLGNTIELQFRRMKMVFPNTSEPDARC